MGILISAKIPDDLMARIKAARERGHDFNMTQIVVDAFEARISEIEGPHDIPGHLADQFDEARRQLQSAADAIGRCAAEIRVAEVGLATESRRAG